METRRPVEGLFGNDFPSIYNHCEVMAAWSRKTLKKIQVLRFFGKKTPYGKIFKILSQKDSSRHRSTCCVRISWNLANGKTGKIVCCLPDKIKQKFRLALQLSLLRGSCPKSTRASPGECAADFIQISSLPPELFPNAWTPSKTSRKVFPIFGWSPASSRIKITKKNEKQKAINISG